MLGRGFSCKCKLLIKPTKIRIDVLRKKQGDSQKYLKGSLAQLLENGLDLYAYARTEEFIVGRNVLSCYDFMKWCCLYILKQLSLLQKQRECPEECRETIGTLMFAASKFPDIPELRDLRDLFQERYGAALEHFANHVFVEEIAANPPTTEKKLQFLQDIASEFSINWDCSGLQRILEPFVSTRDQPKRLEPRSAPDKRRLANGKYTSSYSDKMIDSRKEYNYLNHRRNGVRNIDERGEMILKEPRNKNVLKEEEACKPDTYHCNARHPPCINPRESKKNEDSSLAPEKLMSHFSREKGLTFYDDVPLPKPRSMRKKHCSQNGEDSDIESLISSSNRSSSRRRNTNNSIRRGLSIWLEDEHEQMDEEEGALDDLLLHYSSKPLTFDSEKLIRKPSNNLPSSPPPPAADNEESPDNNPAIIIPPPARSNSLPPQKAGMVEPVKVCARANSIQPNNQRANYVHPKLPDYDELAAYFAALKELHQR